jgi:hypothetical protein
MRERLNGWRQRPRPHDRCSIVTGSFFESIPSGGDAYILRHILHDWSGERCLAILHVCRLRDAFEAAGAVVEGVGHRRQVRLVIKQDLITADI